MNEKLFIRLDVDNAGNGIELELLKSNYNEAQKVHNIIQKNISSVLNKINEKTSTNVLMVGCDDILFSINKNDLKLQFLINIQKEFELNSGFTLSIGVGISIAECMLNLRIAKISGKNRIDGFI